VFSLTQPCTRNNSETDSGPMLRPTMRTEEGGPELKFEQVCFAYPTRPDAEILSGFDLCVHPGETVAVVGASGSGKSTLLALLTALYQPSGGRILFDDHPVCDLDPSWLRDQIGVVTQEPVIFGGTIGA
jgi:ABC-type multidrug transport system fused ATPase/permease subunit